MKILKLAPGANLSDIFTLRADALFYGCLRRGDFWARSEPGDLLVRLLLMILMLWFSGMGIVVREGEPRYKSGCADVWVKGPPSASPGFTYFKANIFSFFPPRTYFTYLSLTNIHTIFVRPEKIQVIYNPAGGEFYLPFWCNSAQMLWKTPSQRCRAKTNPGQKMPPFWRRQKPRPFTFEKEC